MLSFLSLTNLLSLESACRNFINRKNALIGLSFLLFFNQLFSMGPLGPSTDSSSRPSELRQDRPSYSAKIFFIGGQEAIEVEGLNYNKDVIFSGVHMVNKGWFGGESLVPAAVRFSGIKTMEMALHSDEVSLNVKIKFATGKETSYKFRSDMRLGAIKKGESSELWLDLARIKKIEFIGFSTEETREAERVKKDKSSKEAVNKAKAEAVLSDSKIDFNFKKNVSNSAEKESSNEPLINE